MSHGDRVTRLPDGFSVVAISENAPFAAIADEARRRWPDLGRIALIHRVGRIELGESSVLCVVSAPHRPEAFVAARFAIDAVKASAPIWKHETWSGGSSWGTGATAPVDPSMVPSLGDEASV